MIENDYYIFYATAKVNGRIENIQCWHGCSKTLTQIDKAKGFTFNPLHGKGGAGVNGVENSEGNGGRELAEYGRCNLDCYDTV